MHGICILIWFKRRDSLIIKQMHNGGWFLEMQNIFVLVILHLLHFYSLGSKGFFFIVLVYIYHTLFKPFQVPDPAVRSNLIVFIL